MNKPKYVWMLWSQKYEDESEALDWVFANTQPSVEDVEKAVKQVFRECTGHGAGVKWHLLAAHLRAKNFLASTHEANATAYDLTLKKQPTNSQVLP